MGLQGGVCYDGPAHLLWDAGNGGRIQAGVGLWISGQWLSGAGGGRCLLNSGEGGGCGLSSGHGGLIGLPVASGVDRNAGAVSGSCSAEVLRAADGVGVGYDRGLSDGTGLLGLFSSGFGGGFGGWSGS